MAKTRKQRNTRDIKPFDEQKTPDASGQQASARSVIVAFMKTHSTKNPFDPNSPDVRTRTYQHPNERFRKFGTWDKI